VLTCFFLDLVDLVTYLIEDVRHTLVHRGGILSLNFVYRVPVSLEKLCELLFGKPGKDGGSGNLVSIEMENREYCTVSCGIWRQLLKAMMVRLNILRPS